MFRYDRDVESALKRIAYEPGLEGTPADHFSEAALTAQVMVSIGLPDNARRVLEQMHSDGVGYQRPAKKDPQYLLWEDFFQRANHEDPTNRPERVKFFGRLLGGMANTEGEGAANRLTTIFLEEAVQTGSMLAASAADLLEECDLSTWADTVGAFATGLSKGTPDLTEVSAAIFGRLSIPFNSEVDKDQLADLIRKAPAGQIASVVRILVTALETDAPLDCRILAVEKVIETAAERGIKYGTDSLQRWRAELPAPRSGNSPEDPFFNLRTLDEVANLLESTRESSNRYGARSAFRKAAPHCKYSLAKSLFDKEEELNTDERVIETMAQLAIANRKQDDAEALLSSLRGLADARGSWGEYFSGQAKRRYFQLRVDLGHKQAREDAFDAFVEDLGNGRVSPEYLLPELGLLFELISPTITWAQAWNTLASHLAQFREYKRGNEMALRKDIPSGPEQSVADILFRAFETTSVPLTRMARSSAIEIANYHNGVSVIEALLTRLWRRGGHSALEASQIAWECRSVALLKGAIERLIPAMAESDDIAIQRTAMALAHKWNLGVSGKLGDLPEIYSLTLPHDANSETFDPPSGMSLSSAGLYSEDLLSWTWVLQLPLRIASSASGLDLLNIRHRAAQLMSRAGGTDEFGTEAVERQMAKLRRLSLHTSYRKLMNSTAFQAMREVVGELVAAESIDPRAVPVLSLRCGGFSPIVRSKSPTIRPVGIPAPDLPEIFGSPSKTNWTEGVDADLVRPKVKGFLVLAATATHKQRLRDETWRIEQYFGPATKFGGKDLCHHVQHLPEVVLTNVIEVRFDVPSIGGVARPEPDMPGSIDWETFMLCPVIASRLGWKPVAGDAFTFRNAEQEVVAFTMHWRDGGIDSREGDTSKHRYGFALLIREDQLPIFSPFLAEEYEVRAWRRFKKSQEDEETIRSAYRRAAPPSFSTSLSAI